MKTVILKWNPAVSSYSMLHYLSNIRELNQYDEPDFDWSVWDHEQIHEGDRFYWLKVGQYGQTGIVGTGIITSDPYASEDWSGKGRQTFYVDFAAEMLLNPDALPVLSTEALQAAIPDFEWTGGHSGLVLTDEQAEKLDMLWMGFVQENSELFEKARNLGRGDDDLIFTKQEDEEQFYAYSVEYDTEDEDQDEMTKIMDAAEKGVWTEDVRDLIDGFDRINGVIGSFHDSELLSVYIDHDARTAEMTFHMMNGVDLLVNLLFEDVKKYEVFAFRMDSSPYLDFGYFFRCDDLLVFQIDGYGSIEAGKMKVISVKPFEEQEQ